MNIKDTLFQLTNTLGGSGKEFAVAELIGQMIAPYTDKIEVNSFGSLIATKHSDAPNAKTIMLEAHTDQMVMVTIGITDDGFIRFIAQGFDPRQLYGADVLIDTRRHGLIAGVVNTVPGSFNTAGATDTVKVEELTVDIGYPAEMVKEIVTVGDFIYYANETIQLAGERICGRAMDDRAGAAILLETARRLSSQELPVNIVYAFNPREETGGPGASLTGYTVRPDYAIVIDGTNGKCYAYAGSDSFGFEQGAVIGRGDHSYPNLSDALVKTAKENDIPYAVNLILAHSKTNAGRLESAGLGIKTAVIEFPMRYAHSSIEVADINNLNCICDLLEKFLLNGGIAE